MSTKTFESDPELVRRNLRHCFICMFFLLIAALVSGLCCARFSSAPGFDPVLWGIPVACILGILLIAYSALQEARRPTYRITFRDDSLLYTLESNSKIETKVIPYADIRFAYVSTCGFGKCPPVVVVHRSFRALQIPSFRSFPEIAREIAMKSGRPVYMNLWALIGKVGRRYSLIPQAIYLIVLLDLFMLAFKINRLDSAQWFHALSFWELYAGRFPAWLADWIFYPQIFIVCATYIAYALTIARERCVNPRKKFTRCRIALLFFSAVHFYVTWSALSSRQDHILAGSAHGLIPASWGHVLEAAFSFEKSLVINVIALFLLPLFGFNENPSEFPATKLTFRAAAPSANPIHQKLVHIKK